MNAINYALKIAFEMLLTALQAIAFLGAWLVCSFVIINGLLYTAAELGWYAPTVTENILEGLSNWLPYGGVGAFLAALTVFGAYMAGQLLFFSLTVDKDKKPEDH
ncbi:hypothetical protein [Halomonas casei]|uniref:hypothetical protein n=1 Tax=Halomonas casei TaxID=2742613 RepID=UPI003CEE7231